MEERDNCDVWHLQKKIAANITSEQGKTLADAEGDVMRGLQVVEHCCSITNLQLGETMPGIAKDMDLISYREPLGVTAGVTPFNFPAMIPLWVAHCLDTLTQSHTHSLTDVPRVAGLWQHHAPEAQ